GGPAEAGDPDPGGRAPPSGGSPCRPRGSRGTRRAGPRTHSRSRDYDRLCTVLLEARLGAMASKLVEPEMEPAVVALRCPEVVAPGGFQKRRVGHVRRRR